MNSKVLPLALGALLCAAIAFGVFQYTSNASLREANVKLVQDGSRHECRDNLQEISGAMMAYRVATRSNFTDDFQKLGKYLDASALICPKDGKYRIDLLPSNSFTIHCSVDEHDKGESGQPDGYSPGLNDK